MANLDTVNRTTGRRKSSSAQVRMIAGTGQMVVNDLDVKKYFASEIARSFIRQPLIITDTIDKVDILATLKGGGVMGQAGALRHGIARALVDYNNALKSTLKSAGMLTRDPREKERKKSGQPGARKRFQFSKR